MQIARTPVARPAAPRAARPAAATAPAPAVKKAQAAPSASPMTFTDLDSYKRYVLASPVAGLPAARDRANQAGIQLAAANRALEARKAALGQPRLAQAAESARQALDSANHPGREREAQLRSQAAALTAQISGVAQQISRLQQQIAQSEGNKAARNRDAWNNDNPSGWEVVGDLLGDIGDSSAIKSARTQISKLIDQKVALETQVTTLIAEATAEAHRPGDPATVQQAQSALDAAQAALAKVESQFAPEQQAVTAAQAAQIEAQARLKGLEDQKAQLKDYRARFSFGTRLGLMVHHFGWKKELDAFWQQQGL